MPDMLPEIRTLFVSVVEGGPVHLRLLGLLPDPVAAVRVVVHSDLRVEAWPEARGPEPSVDDRTRAAPRPIFSTGCADEPGGAR